MLRPSLETLKHIVVEVDVGDDDIDPLFGIPSELEEMGAKNVIETVTIRIVVGADVDYRREGDDWGRLDEVLTAPGWFSLKRVSLAIELGSIWGDNEPEVALRNLHETQFRRLSSSNSILFDFKVNFVRV